jgi:hypothetical protein
MNLTYAEVLEMDEHKPIELARSMALSLLEMTLDDLQDAAGYLCTKLDFKRANGDDEDEEEEEEEDEDKKKEQDEEDEDDDDDDDGAIQRLSRQAGNMEQDIAAVEDDGKLAELSRRVRGGCTPDLG